jgi:hypothetical protein
MLEALIGILLLAGASSQASHERDRHRQQLIFRLMPPPELDFVPEAFFDSEKPYRIAGITFDSVNGIGAMPINANINYMGFMVWMTPNQFLALNPVNPEEGKWIEDQIRQGAPIGPMYLSVRVKGEIPSDYDLFLYEEGKVVPTWSPLSIEVHQHEGRTRAKVLQRLGLGEVSFPVNITARHRTEGEVRARQLKATQLLGMKIYPDPRRRIGARSMMIRQVTLQKKNYGELPSFLAMEPDDIQYKLAKDTGPAWETFLRQRSMLPITREELIQWDIDQIKGKEPPPTALVAVKAAAKLAGEKGASLTVALDESKKTIRDSFNIKRLPAGFFARWEKSIHIAYQSGQKQRQKAIDAAERRREQAQATEERRYARSMPGRARTLFDNCDYRRSESSWVGGGHTTTIYINADVDAHGWSEEVWHEKHNWKGTNSFHDVTVHPLWARRVEGPGLAVIGDKFVLNAIPYKGSLCRGTLRAWNATLVEQSRGVDLRPQTGFIVEDEDGRYFTTRKSP